MLPSNNQSGEIIKTWQDPKTKLVWMAKKSDNPLNWGHAVKLGFYDLEDESFYLPSVQEFMTLIDYKQHASAFRKDVPFKDSQLFWTSTKYADNPKEIAWSVDMTSGNFYPSNQMKKCFVICLKKAK